MKDSLEAHKARNRRLNRERLPEVANRIQLWAERVPGSETLK